jgi:hypothetical protein
MSIWTSAWGRSVGVIWFKNQIDLLWASVTGGDPPDLGNKSDSPATFTAGNFATYNPATNAIEDTEFNEASFVSSTGFIATEENYTTIEKAQLAALVANGGGGGYETHDKTNTNKSAAFTKAVTAGSILLYVIIQRVIGTPVFSLGTTLAGDDLIPEVEFAAGTKPLVQPMNEPFESVATLYATITGGTVNVIFITYESILII